MATAQLSVCLLTGPSAPSAPPPSLHSETHSLPAPVGIFASLSHFGSSSCPDSPQAPSWFWSLGGSLPQGSVLSTTQPHWCLGSSPDPRAAWTAMCCTSGGYISTHPHLHRALSSPDISPGIPQGTSTQHVQNMPIAFPHKAPPPHLLTQPRCRPTTTYVQILGHLRPLPSSLNPSVLSTTKNRPFRYLNMSAVPLPLLYLIDSLRNCMKYMLLLLPPFYRWRNWETVSLLCPSHESSKWRDHRIWNQAVFPNSKPIITQLDCL